jgi:hypothetical protein
MDIEPLRDGFVVDLGLHLVGLPVVALRAHVELGVRDVLSTEPRLGEPTEALRSERDEDDLVARLLVRLELAHRVHERSVENHPTVELRPVSKLPFDEGYPMCHRRERAIDVEDDSARLG